MAYPNATSVERRTPQPTGLLEAVNVLLRNIGEAPVNDLENEQVVEARMARDTLLEIHKEVQTRGWAWNTDRIVFQRDTTGKIPVPANVVRWTVEPCLRGRLALRGQYVYDRATSSYTVGDDLTEVEAEVVVLLSWDETPEPVNRYVTIRAARVFADRVVTSDALFRYTGTDEQLAWAEVQRMELENERFNWLDGPNSTPPLRVFDIRRGVSRGMGYPYEGVIPR